MNSVLEQQYLLFRVGEVLGCFSLDETLSVINPPHMIRLQSARGSIIRAFRHQDELGAVVSMHKKFAQPEQTDYSAGRLILGRIHGRLAGFWVDEVLGITRLSDTLAVEDEDLARQFEGGALDRVILYHDKRYLHLAMLPFMLFENPQQISDWLEGKQAEWHRRDLAIKEAEQSRQREQERAARMEQRDKELEQLQRQMDTLYIDPEVTLEYAQGLLEVAEYNEQQREAEAARAREAAEAEAAAAAAAAAEQAGQEVEAEAIELPELGQVEDSITSTVVSEAPDALFEEEQPRQKPKRRILWGARRQAGDGPTLRGVSNLQDMRPGLKALFKRWGNRLAIVVVLLCLLLIFKTIEPMLFKQIISAIQQAFTNLEPGQWWGRLWHKISA